MAENESVLEVPNLGWFAVKLDWDPSLYLKVFTFITRVGCTNK